LRELSQDATLVCTSPPPPHPCLAALQFVHKPGDYETEEALMRDLYTRATSCTRHYYILWYEAYVRATGAALPGPWTGPRVPSRNSTHDDLVHGWRIEHDVKPNKGAPCKKAEFGRC
jgi:hypothetical protein